MDNDSIDYVRAALRLQGYRFEEAQITEIAAQFSRIAAVAKVILQLDLAPDAELAPVFRP